MKKGFTFIEILVVVSIIGLLTGVAALSYRQFSKQARDAKRRADLENIRQALEMYRSANDVYPDDLNTLVGPTVYIQKLPADPQSPTYQYAYTPANGSYQIGAYFEASSPSSSCTLACGVGTCNYCLTPYGQL